jgi:hypothetical protein
MKKKRNWSCNPNWSSFCNQLETKYHLFFNCSSAKVVWVITGTVFNTSTWPTSVWQCLTWLFAFWPWEKKIIRHR